MNHNILVEAKKEYTNQLLQILKPRIYEGFKSMYDDTVSILGKEYIEYNTQSSSVIKSFQKALRDIPLWNQEMINREYDRILNSSKCDYFEDLIETVFITNIKILSSVQINSNNSIGLQVNIPSPVHFIHKCYIECAKEIYKNPYVFENSKNMTPKEKHTNIRDSLTYIENSINSAIRELLPIRDILKQGISKANSSVNNIASGGGMSASDEKSKKSEYLSEEEEETEVTDETEETEVTDVTEDTSELPSISVHKEGEKSVILNNNEHNTAHAPVHHTPNNQLLIEEASVKDDYVSQISDVSDTDNIIEQKQLSPPSDGIHLFDKLSKTATGGSGNSIKNIIGDTQTIPVYNKPVIEIDNRPPEIKEIFIGKQNMNNLVRPNIFSLKSKENTLIRNKLHSGDKTNSLYKKKYDEYLRNSQINSSSINNNTDIKSVSSAKSNSKTIVLEDASEYVSDNIDF
jgi:hypothetical protein